MTPNQYQVALEQRIHQICASICQGKAAKDRWEVTAQRILRILSIVLSGLGSAGLIVDRVAGGPPGGSGGAFWVWIAVLVFGIVLQIADELEVGQIAAHARTLAAECALRELELDIVLQVPDPRTGVKRLQKTVNDVILKYGRVVKPLTIAQVTISATDARGLIAKHQTGWSIPTPSPKPPKKRGAKPVPLPPPVLAPIAPPAGSGSGAAIGGGGSVSASGSGSGSGSVSISGSGSGSGSGSVSASGSASG